ASRRASSRTTSAGCGRPASSRPGAARPTAATPGTPSTSRGSATCWPPPAPRSTRGWRRAPRAPGRPPGPASCSSAPATAPAPPSAGSHPKPLHPLAVRVRRDEHGIDIGGHRPRHLREVAADRYDRVVTLCDRVREVCPELPGDPPAVHWSIPDPATAAAGGDAYLAFRRTAAELATRVDFLLADLSRPSGTEPYPA